MSFMCCRMFQHGAPTCSFASDTLLSPLIQPVLSTSSAGIIALNPLHRRERIRELERDGKQLTSQLDKYSQVRPSGLAGLAGS